MSTGRPDDADPTIPLGAADRAAEGSDTDVNSADTPEALPPDAPPDPPPPVDAPPDPASPEPAPPAPSAQESVPPPTGSTPPLPPPPSERAGWVPPPPPPGALPPPPPPGGRPGPPGGTGSSSGAAAVSGRPLLRRHADDRVLAGVCSGLARHLGVDPWLVRIAFIVFTLAWGSGAFIYALLWVAIPEERPGDHVGRTSGSDATTASLAIGGLLVVAGVFLLADRLVPSLGRFLWPLILIGIGVAIVVSSRR